MPELLTKSNPFLKSHCCRHEIWIRQLLDCYMLHNKKHFTKLIELSQKESFLKSHCYRRFLGNWETQPSWNVYKNNLHIPVTSLNLPINGTLSKSNIRWTVKLQITLTKTNSRSIFFLEFDQSEVNLRLRRNRTSPKLEASSQP